VPQFGTKGKASSVSDVLEASSAAYVLVIRVRGGNYSRILRKRERLLRRFGLGRIGSTVLVANAPHLSTTLLGLRQQVQVHGVVTPASIYGIQVLESPDVTQILDGVVELGPEMTSGTRLLDAVRSIQEFARPDASEVELERSANMTSREILAAGNHPISNEARAKLREEASLIFEQG